MTKLIILFIISLWCLSGFSSEQKEKNELEKSGSARPKQNWIEMWNKETSSASRSSFSSQSINEPSTSNYPVNSYSAAQSSDADSKLYTCADCSQTYTDRSNLNRHRKSKHDNVKYECSICYQNFAFIGGLNEHKKTVHEGFRYECSSCSKKFKNFGNLYDHKKATHEGVRYVCPICDKKYSYPSDLNRHTKKAHKVR